MQKTIFFLLVLSFTTWFGCNNESESSSDKENNESTIDLEELEKSDQEKSDSVEKYWKDKMNQN